MSYVDLIIKYLSGDLSREEATSFEKELESNKALREAFEAQSAAYELIGDQLQKRDQKAFRAKLQEAMSHDAPISGSRKVGFRSWWYIPPAVACSLAILLIVLLSHPGNERILTIILQRIRSYLPTSRIPEENPNPELLSTDSVTISNPWNCSQYGSPRHGIINCSCFTTCCRPWNWTVSRKSWSWSG